MDSSDSQHKRPKKLIFAPGDINATPGTQTPQPTSESVVPESVVPVSALPAHVADSLRSETMTPSTEYDNNVRTHPARAHQFVRNPPLTISQLHPTNPLYQFHAWFRDPRLEASSAPETCTLATAELPSGRVSARVVYLKELDERGWTVYSNWGSREGKGKHVFGVSNVESGGDIPEAIPLPDEPLVTDLGLEKQGNKWAALTFLWSTLERQVRIEGLVEPLSRDESEMYWKTRERGSQIGAWASWQSKVLWSAEPENLVNQRRKSFGPGEDSGNIVYPEIPHDVNETDIDDGRALLEKRVKEMEVRFADTKEIPLPPFWGGVRLIPESVEFWQGRKSRLHDRFRYVRIHWKDDASSSYKWRVERLSP